MKLIETKTLGTAAASIEFTSIPQTFTDLVMLCSIRTTRTPDIEDNVFVQFNNVTTAYNFTYLRGQGSTAQSAAETGSYALIHQNAAGNTANTFSNASIYIPNYTAAINKSISIDTVNENNATAAWAAIVAYLWANTAAITSVKFTPGVGPNFVTGTTISLYGITKGSSGGVVVS